MDWYTHFIKFNISCILQLINYYVIKEEQYHSSSRLISVASRLLASRLETSLSRPSLNITVEQWRILFYLWNEDGINQQELAKRASKEKSTITRQIEGLVKKELVIKQKGGNDKRDKLIYLTENGKKIETEALSVAWDITQEAEKGIEGQELLIFKKVLQQIIENVKL